VEKKSILFIYWKQAQQWVEKKAYYNGHEYWKQAQQWVEKKEHLITDMRAIKKAMWRYRKI